MMRNNNLIIKECNMSFRFVKDLEKEDIICLAHNINFKVYSPDFCKGNKKFYKNGQIIFYTWDKDHVEPCDYDERYLCLEDFSIFQAKIIGSNAINQPEIDSESCEFYKIMIKKFGRKWIDLAFDHFMKTNQYDKVKILEKAYEEFELQAETTI